jgi:hypothetical protein
MVVGDSFKVDDRETFLKATRAAYMYGKRHQQRYTAAIKYLRIWRVR